MFKRLPATPHSNQFIGIQYLRGIAVLFVIFDHVTGMSKLPHYFGPNYSIFNDWLQCGGVGVDLFFVISGFIIYYVTINEYDLAVKIDFKSFFKHRIIRILPFLWVCVIATALLKLLGRGTFPVWEYIRAITLFPVGTVEPRPVWSLRNEFMFYIIFGLSIICFKEYKFKWGWLILWFLTPVIWFGIGLQNFITIHFLKNLLDFIFDYHNLTFGIGVFIAYLYKKGYLKYELSVKMGFLLCLIVCIPLLFIAHILGMKNASNSFIQVIPTGLYSGLIVLLGLIIVANKNLNFINRIGLILGNSSYAIYLTHTAVISAMLGIVAKHYHQINPAILFVLGCILAVSVGILAHFYIEKPLIKFVKSKFDKGTRAKILVPDNPAAFK